jgi:hypothetical protein
MQTASNSSKRPRVLLASPTSDVKRYCQDQWLDLLANMTYLELDFLIVENSNDSRNYAEIKSQNDWIDVVRCKPKPRETIRDRVLRSTKIIYDRFINGGYDYWFSLESDVFCPINTIEHLLGLRKPVVGLPYFHFSGDKTRVMNMVSFDVDGVQYFDYEEPFITLLNSNGEARRAFQTGLGCLLIHRSAMNNIKIRIGSEFPKGYPDSFLHLDWWQNDVPVFMDTTHYCYHKNDDKAWKKINSQRKK